MATDLVLQRSPQPGASDAFRMICHCLFIYLLITHPRVKFDEPTHGSVIARLPLRGHEHRTVCQSNCETLNCHLDNSGGHLRHIFTSIYSITDSCAGHKLTYLLTYLLPDSNYLSPCTHHEKWLISSTLPSHIRRLKTHLFNYQFTFHSHHPPLRSSTIFGWG